MIRRFNYTNRKTIAREHTRIEVHVREGDAPWFESSLTLDSYGFPDDARIRIEAWRSNAVQRWEYGTVGNVVVPPRSQRELTEVPESAQFRLAVVAGDESGRLYGLSKDLRPLKVRKNEDGKERREESLLPVELSGELGQEVWRLQLGEGEPPVLLLNERIDRIAEAAAGDPSLRALTMPGVLRAVLQHAIFVDMYDPDGEEPDAYNDWIMISELHAETELPRVEDRETERAQIDAWIDRVVAAFAAHPLLEAADTYAEAMEKIR